MCLNVALPEGAVNLMVFQ